MESQVCTWQASEMMGMGKGRCLLMLMLLLTMLKMCEFVHLWLYSYINRIIFLTIIVTSERKILFSWSLHLTINANQILMNLWLNSTGRYAAREMMLIYLFWKTNRMTEDVRKREKPEGKTYKGMHTERPHKYYYILICLSLNVRKTWEIIMTNICILDSFIPEFWLPAVQFSLRVFLWQTRPGSEFSQILLTELKCKNKYIFWNKFSHPNKVTFEYSLFI